jgi:hypothetical protein
MRNMQVEEVDGFDMVRRMAAEVQIMMQHKIDAIKRIMELAENIALDHKYDKVTPPLKKIYFMVPGPPSPSKYRSSKSSNLAFSYRYVIRPSLSA